MPDGKLLMRYADSQGKIRLPVLRVPGTPTPCNTCPKIPSGQPKSRLYAIELSPKNEAAYNHYLECRATQMFPDDALVRVHASAIAQVIEEYRQHELLTVLVGLRKLNG